MYKFQHRPIDSEDEWTDDDRLFGTEAEAELHANRLKLMADVETQVVEAD